MPFLVLTAYRTQYTATSQPIFNPNSKLTKKLLFYNYSIKMAYDSTVGENKAMN